MIYVLIVIVIVVLGYLLIKQSKKPSGILGKLMIGIWNKTYQSLYINALNKYDRTKFKNILDVGIGGGLSTKYISEYFLDAHVIGIDYSLKAIEEARINNSVNIDNKRVGIIQGDVTRLGLKKKQFDLVCAFQSHFHWSDFKLGLQEIYKVMADESVLILACEQNKLNYYLKDYNTLEKLELLASTIGFSKVIETKSQQYVEYTFTKSLSK